MRELEAQKARIADRTKWVQVSDEATARGLKSLIEGLQSGDVEDALGEFLTTYFNGGSPSRST